MAKKNKDSSMKEVQVGNAAINDVELGTSPASAKDAKKKNTAKKDKKPGIFSRIGRKFKEMFSELKKVTWLSPKETFGRLGTVLLVVLIFLVVVLAFDSLCAYLLRLLTGGNA